MKLFLYSAYVIADEHNAALARLVGKAPQDITMAAITNSLDVYDDNDWLGETLASLSRQGAQVEVVDLREWRGNRAGLREKLASKDVIWLCGGHTYYLRWILKDSGADEMIRELVRQGTVYAGWSAGAGMAGPTLRFFDYFDDPNDAPEAIYEGLGLTNVVVVPHTDLPDFAEGMKLINQQLQEAGYRTVPLTDAEAIMIDGDEETLL
jgi:dipeptidase E